MYNLFHKPPCWDNRYFSTNGTYIGFTPVILSAGLHLYRRVPTSEHCWKKIVVVHSGLEPATFGLQV